MTEFLNSKIEEMVKRSKSDVETDEVRFSLTFSKFNNRRIEYIRRSLKLSKQELLSNIIIAAICDIEHKLGLVEPYETTQGTQMALVSEYEKIINSKKSITSYFKGE